MSGFSRDHQGFNRSRARLLRDRNELLNALPVLNFSRINVALRIDGNRVDPVELTRVPSISSERSFERAGLAIQDLHHVVRSIGDEDVPLLRIAREREVVNGATRRRRRTPDAAAVRAAGLRRGMHPELRDELALLGEHLNPVAAPLTDVTRARPARSGCSAAQVRTGSDPEEVR